MLDGYVEIFLYANIFSKIKDSEKLDRGSQDFGTTAKESTDHPGKLRHVIRLVPKTCYRLNLCIRADGRLSEPLL
jgi:hypothetical protein